MIDPDEEKGEDSLLYCHHHFNSCTTITVQKKNPILDQGKKSKHKTIKYDYDDGTGIRINVRLLLTIPLLQLLFAFPFLFGACFLCFRPRKSPCSRP